MYITRKILTESVSIEGLDFWGNYSKVVFEPYDHPGWWWDTQYAGIVPIDHRIAYAKNSRIELRVGPEYSSVWEHLTPLRFTGLDALSVKTDFYHWLPYLTAKEYENCFVGKTKEISEYIPFVQPTYSKNDIAKNKLSSRVSISPAEQFSLHAVSQWEDLPLYEESLWIEEVCAWYRRDDIFTAKPQALSSRFHMARICSLVGLWPHMERVAWKKEFATPENASYAWWLHGVQDRLGEIAFASHDALPCAQFFFFKTGHAQVLSCLKQSFPL